jgi:hypothetical protein
MKDRDIILGVLRRIERRLWIRRALQEIAFGACVVLFSIIAFQSVSPAPVDGMRPAAARAAVATALLLLAIYIAWRVSRPVTLAQAAGEADYRARLRDELKSAYCFVNSPDSSPFADLQIARAAKTAAGLHPVSIVPAEPPRSLLAAIALGAILAFTSGVTPRVSHSWDVADPRLEISGEAPQDLRALLEDAPANEQIERLDRALEALQNSDSPAQAKSRAVAQARDAIEQANMEAAAAREGLAKLAEIMQGKPGFEETAQALKQGNIEEAMERLREMQAAVDSGDAGRIGEDDAASAADEGQGAEGNLERELEQAGRDLGGTDAKVNQDTVDRVLRSLERAGEQIEVQNRVNSVKRRMESNLVATSQRSALTASQFGQRANAPNPTPSPDTGNSEIQGGTMYRQGAVAREEDDDALRDGSKTGSASGQSSALALEGAATQRLEAQLKLETIGRRDDSDADSPGAQGWFYSASREQKSLLELENVRGHSNAAREGAMGHARVPMRQKRIVKDYFLNLHESESK